MGLFEETDSPANDVGNAASRQLKLQLGGLITRAKQHRNLRKINVRFFEFQNTLSRESGFLPGVADFDKKGIKALSVHTFQVLGKLMGVVAFASVGGLENLCGRAVICLKFENVSVGVIPRKIQD